MASRKRAEGIGSANPDDESNYSDDEPPRKRPKFHKRGKAHQVDSEDEDPSYELGSETQRPKRKPRKSARQTSKSQAPATRPPAKSASNRRFVKKPKDNNDVETAEDKNAQRNEEYLTSEATRETQEASALGITWQGVSTNSAEIIGIFCGAWKNRVYESSKYESLTEILQQRIDERDEKLAENDLEIDAMYQEIHDLRFKCQGLQEQRMINRTHESVIAGMDKEMKDKDKEIAKLRNDDQESKCKIASLEKEVAELKQAALEKDKSVAGVSDEAGVEA